jgi:HlyD family secretion protein
MKKIIFPLLLIVLGVGGYTAWHYWKSSHLLEESRSITLYGNVEIRRVNLSFRVGGRIAEILFREGDQIPKGKVIARLDREPFEDNLAVAEAQIQSAAANYAKLQAGHRPQEIEQAKATVSQRTASLRVLEADLERATQLIAREANTQQDLDTVLAQRDEAIAAKRLAEETLSLLVEGFRQEDIAAGKALLSEANANFKRLKTSLDDTELLCPNEGTLLTRVEEPGAVVNPGQPIATLSLRDEVWVYVYIPATLMGVVQSGMKAEIYTDAAPEKPYTGQVGYISPEAEFTPKTVQTTELRTNLVYRVRVIVDTPNNGGLCQGMPVTVKLRTD